jgi:menaquinone-dependent protoporphyrinogen IX oxidase
MLINQGVRIFEVSFICEKPTIKGKIKLDLPISFNYFKRNGENNKMKTVVIYKSITGFTKKYAVWIKEELDADIFRYEEIDADKLLEYNTIIYGGSLHAAGITGIKLISKNFEKLNDKNIIIFVTGASPFKKELIDEIKEKNLKEEEREYIKLFYFRGGFNFNKLNFTNKILMTLFKWKLQLMREKTPEARGMLASYEKPVDFTRKEKIKELIDYVNSLK